MSNFLVKIYRNMRDLLKTFFESRQFMGVVFIGIFNGRLKIIKLMFWIFH